ncbi:hypothetical protein C4B63_9g203 [Trypanosoma cruzi]|uniref:Uncharacterized protein n=1 Tax=Trypanosoma cruzi TaxID=5693 RepID=A0A2V2VT55_TRYCR|nr:hypothetical protein C4B63_9g203 [Trypanosoma cruzi]
MQKENDRMRKKKDETREEEEISIFHCDDGSVYEGRVTRREIPVELPLGMPTPAPASTLRGQPPPEVMPQIVSIQHGKGIFKDAGGTIYDGNWIEGAMCGRVSCSFLVGPHTPAVCAPMNFVVQALTIGPMVLATKGSGKIIGCMDLEFTLMLRGTLGGEVLSRIWSWFIG